MNGVLEDLASARWWFSLVIVGLLINVLGAFGKAYVDRWLTVHSERRRSKRMLRDMEFAQRVHQLENDDHAQVMLCFRAYRLRLSALFMVTLSFPFSLAAGSAAWFVAELPPITVALTVTLFAVLLVFFAVLMSRDYNTLISLLAAAREGKPDTVSFAELYGNNRPG